MKRMFRYGLVGLAIALVAVLAVGQVIAQDYPPQVEDALGQKLMQDLFSDVLEENNVKIVFGDAGDAAATTSYNAAENTYTITIDWAYEGADVEVLKALLAHELTHVSWGENGFGPLTFEEEYDCWQTEAEVWRFYKDGLTNDELDQGERIIYTNDELRNREEVRTELEGVGYTFSD